MVIINSQTAQLANRLWHFSGFIANSIEHKYELVNIGFFRYRSFFEATSNNDFKGYPISITRTHIPYLDYFYSNLFKNWASFTYRKFGRTPTLYKFYQTTFTTDKEEIIFDLNNPEFVHDAQKRKVLVEGWLLRDSANIQKHAAIIREFFKPVEPYRSQVEQTINEAKKLADVVVGVHIRRGDYSSFQGGIWCYTDDVYADKMRQIEMYYARLGKSCAFLICSNDAINPYNFPGLNVFSAQRHFIVDLYLLAACDVIIGPPSTFSQWAAFYGEKILRMILDKNDQINSLEFDPHYISKDNFPIRNLYLFA